MSPVILTGMHRSGTSAVTRLIQSMGFDVGSDLLPATENNLHGHFEEMAFIRFHDELINRLFPERAPFCEWLPLAAAKGTYSEADKAEAKSIWEKHRATGAIAWKDPRTSLFLDLWTQVLPDARVIVCLRHPYQVHLSLLRRGEPFLHVDYSASIRGWDVYNQSILRALAPLPRDRFIVLDVEAAFKEPAVLAERLARFLGIPLPSQAFRAVSPEEFHFAEDLAGILPHFEDFFPDIAATYRQLTQFDSHQPVATSPTDQKAPHPIRSEDARLIEFEEIHGLRSKAKRMLIRSVVADRRRLTDLYRLSGEAHAEKDRLIDDLTRFNERLKTEVLRRNDPPATT